MRSPRRWWDWAGWAAFDATALQKKLSGKVASVDANISLTQEGVSGSASPRDLETLFELVWLRMTAPRADTTAFRAFVSNVRSAIANRGADPDAVFSDSLSVTLSSHHPRTRPITPARIDSLDLGTAYRVLPRPLRRCERFHVRDRGRVPARLDSPPGRRAGWAGCLRPGARNRGATPGSRLRAAWWSRWCERASSPGAGPRSCSPAPLPIRGPIAP